MELENDRMRHAIQNDWEGITLPLPLSLSQEEFLMSDVSVSTSTTQVSKTYNFSNYNIIFNN